MITESHALIVLGMHRSGTSAFTGLLSVLGVDVGPRLLAATGENESGYWEHGDVLALHEQLLAQLGSDWADPSRLPQGWVERPEAIECRRRLREVLERDFATSPLWAVKEPRMCRLLPMWTRLLDEMGCKATWILLTRHPAENGRSLEKRNGFTPEKSALLWLQHTLDMESETRGRNRVVLAYDQLFADGAGTLDRVRQAAGVEWPAPASVALEQARQFIDPTKRHHTAGQTASAFPWVAETYAALLAGSTGDQAKMEQMLDPVRAAFEIADTLYRPVIRGRAVDLEEKLTESSAQYAAVWESREQTREKYLKSRKNLAKKTLDLDRAKETLQQYERSPGAKLNRLLRHRRAEAKTEVAVKFPPLDESIEFTIIVTAGNDPARTAQCLRVLRQQTPGEEFAAIVVGSEGAVEPLQQWENLETVVAEAGLPFGEPHNRAAQKARGQFLVFIDDSVNVQPGWSDALLDALRSKPDAGLIGVQAVALSRDGGMTLLEVDDSEDLREADLCTTACVALPRNLFFQAGGFDTYYLPVEEANIAMKIRQTRHKIYQLPSCPVSLPKCERPIDEGRMASSREKFVRRWADALAQYA
jgi:hypothetical protein